MSKGKKIGQNLASKAIYGFSLGRSFLFLLEQKPLPYIRKIFDRRPTELPPESFQKSSFESLNTLLKEDAQNIAEGYYPQSVLRVEKPLVHIKRLLKVWMDAFFLNYRRSKNQHKVFSQKAQKLLKGLPDYYQRNFHNQTDGYLSDQSAEIYDHQVDMLFSGSTGAMRRSILKPMAQYLGQKKSVKILEVGCGAGSFTRYLAQTFPEAQITALDLSSPYLKLAKKQCREFDNVDFVTGVGEQLDYKEETFDVVVSVFLFHELPLKVRKEIIEEGRRVLKPGGFYALVDSLQLHDTEDLSWALKQFPKMFHEPFYLNYLRSPVENQVSEVFEIDSVGISKHFLSKCVFVEKSL